MGVERNMGTRRVGAMVGENMTWREEDKEGRHEGERQLGMVFNYPKSSIILTGKGSCHHLGQCIG